MIKQSEVGFVQLPDWQNKVVIDKNNINQTIKLVLSEIKRNRQAPIDTTLKSLRQTTQIKYHNLDNTKLFMNWDMVRELKKSGIMSQLLKSEQIEEVQLSKQQLESQLDTIIQAFAYPEGGPTTYNQKTINALEIANYHLAFNFIPGINKEIIKSRFQLKRLSISDNCSVEDIKLQCISY